MMPPPSKGISSRSLFYSASVLGSVLFATHLFGLANVHHLSPFRRKALLMSNIYILIMGVGAMLLHNCNYDPSKGLDKKAFLISLIPCFAIVQHSNFLLFTSLKSLPHHLYNMGLIFSIAHVTASLFFILLAFSFQGKNNSNVIQEKGYSLI